LTWDDYVHLAFDEIRAAGAGSPQIVRRLHAAFEDLIAVAPESRRRPLREQLALLESGAERSIDQAADVHHSTRGDSRGIG
jgi:uncharacterized membrane protein